MNVQTPEAARETVFPMFKAPSGRYAVSLRWQGLDIVSSASDYDASAETTFRPPDPITDWQFGPPQRSGRRTTVQVHGDTIGVLSITQDSVKPARAPPAADKHVALSYRFPEPLPVFQGRMPAALMFKATVRVPKFVAHYGSDERSRNSPLGTIYFVMAFKDKTNPAIRQIGMSVLLFDTRGDLRRERIFVDPSNGLQVVTSRLSADRRGKLYTSLASDSAVLSGTVFKDPRTFRFYITPENFLNAIGGLNARGSKLSMNPEDYSMVYFGIVQEQALHGKDESEMALVISDLGLYEAPAVVYQSDIRH
jgi:hypothetical protein